MPQRNSIPRRRRQVVLVSHGERLGRWLVKVMFYVLVGVGTAAFFDQAHLVMVLLNTPTYSNHNNNHHIIPSNGAVVKDGGKRCPPPSSSWESESFTCFSSSSVLPLLQPSPEVSLKRRKPNDPIDPRKVFFIHIHDAKSAGSSLNRYLARRYHAVCGHKGYSFDQLLHVGAEPRYDPKWFFGPDRVMHDDMKARGWHNCRVLSHETKATEILDIILYLQQTFGYYVHVLVPCRDAITQRISKCAYRKMEIHHWTPTKDAQLCWNLIFECDVDENRYSLEYERVADQVSYFWYKNFSQIDRILEPYVPQRGFVLPDAKKVYQTNDAYDPALVEEVTRRCKTRVNQHYIERVDLYQQCAKHVPEVHY
jgi:hypothetical protein